MKKCLASLLAVAVLAIVPLAGCTSVQKAQAVQIAIQTALNIAGNQTTIAAIPVADQPAYDAYITVGNTLNGQLGTCINQVSGVMGKNAKFLACFNTFAQGFLNSNELAPLKVLSPATTAKVQLYLTAAVAAINIAETAYGGAQVTAPVVGPSPTAQELHPVIEAMNAQALRASSL